MSLAFNRRQALVSAVGGFALSSLSLAVRAQSKAIKIVVPFAPGRQMAMSLSTLRSQSVVVENKPGAGGNIGTEQVVRSPADGSTLLLGHSGTVSINPALYKQLKYDTQKDLAPVAMFASSALVLVVPASSKVKSVADLLALAKSQPGRVNYASSGGGTGGHLCGELFAHKTGVKLSHIPYKGTAPALNDLIGGQVQMMFSVIPPALALVTSGRLRAIAVTSAKRNPALPDVPTIAESGIASLADFESTLTYGLLTARGTPDAVVNELAAQILKIAASSEFQSRLGVEGAVPLLGGPAEYAALIKKESTQWAEIVRISGATID
jgi:tripartite-type tricarboxylate transporter receptor subunit TctC